MKIFITGATGFIGKHLIDQLTHTEHELVCLVRTTSNVDTLKEVGITLIEGDVTDKASVLQGMSNCDWVIHLANVYSFWEPQKDIYADVNINGTRNVMECALETEVDKIIHVSTALIYGKPNDCPFSENSDIGPERFSEYARTKYEGDLIAWELHAKQGLPLVVIYPSGVLGPGNPKANAQYIQNLLHRRTPATIFNDSIFTWVRVRDVAEGIIKALEKEGNIGEKYLLGTDNISMQQFNELVHDISGVPLPKLRMPNTLAMLNAALLTWFANLIKKPPMLGMAIDMIRLLKTGLQFDGTKAERELSLKYTSIRAAIEEEISYHRANSVE
jgi:dihydroflavonol-4-reductase